MPRTTAAAVSSQLVSMPSTVRVATPWGPRVIGRPSASSPNSLMPQSHNDQVLRLGTRGSKLATTQSGMVRDLLIARRRILRTGHRQDQRRPHPGPLAGRCRRQGAVHQGARRGAARRPHRSGRAFDEGRAGGDAGRVWRWPRSCSARIRATPFSRTRQGSLAELPPGRAHGHLLGAAAGAVAARAARSRDRAVARQCRHAAGQAGWRRARCDPAGLCGPEAAGAG